jgi:hypothetical protein
MLKKGMLVFASFVMNLFRAAIQSVNFCTSLLVCGGYICRMALILLGLALMHLVEMRQPSTLPHVTSKTHLCGFSLSLASRILVKVFVRSEIYDAFFLLATTMSLMYENTTLPTRSFDAAFVSLRHSTESRACVVQPLWHSQVTIHAKWYYKACFFLILSAKPYMATA